MIDGAHRSAGERLRAEPSGSLDRLKHQYQLRFTEIYDRVSSTRSSLTEGCRDLAGVLRLVEIFLEGIRLASFEGLAKDPTDRLARLELWKLRQVAEYIDTEFLNLASVAPPAWLRDLVWDEAEGIGMPAVPLLAPVHANNFSSAVPSVKGVLFSSAPGSYDFGVDEKVVADLFEEFATTLDYGLVRTSWVDGAAGRLCPLPAGHELAHFALHHQSLLVESDMQTLRERLLGLFSSWSVHHESAYESSDLYDAGLLLGEGWLVELVCDLYMLARFGPASILALGDFAESVARLVPPGYDGTHPSGRVRLDVLLGVMDTCYPTMVKEEPVSTLLKRCRTVVAELVDDGGQRLPPLERFCFDHSFELAQAFGSLLPIAIELSSLRPFCAAARPKEERAFATGIERAAAEFESRRPASGLMSEEPHLPELLGGAWLAIERDFSSAELIDRLLTASIEYRSFGRWLGSEPESLDSTAVDRRSQLTSSKADLDRCHVVPSLSGVGWVGGSLDLRLGPRVLEFSSRPATFFGEKTLSQSRISDQTVDDPRHFQEDVEYRWGDPIRIAPGAFILASTLEYLQLAESHIGWIGHRTSYGRIGLVVDAGPIQPGHSGTITLCLHNVGPCPIMVYPGERVCHLVTSPVDRPVGAIPSLQAGRYNAQNRPVRADFAYEPELVALQRPRRYVPQPFGRTQGSPPGVRGQGVDPR